MKQFRARIVLPLSGPPISDGMVTVDGQQIAAVGPFNGSPATDLGDVILMPGLINAHCHLDYTPMRGAILPNASFSGWVRRLNDLKRTLDDQTYLDAIGHGFAELAASGTTTVFNIESFPELMLRLPQPPLRTWWFYELIDIRNRVHTEDVVAGALSFFESRPGWHGGFGLSPHAPYSTSAELYRLARFCCEKYGMPFMTHLAESDEEFEMFQHGGGALHGFLEGLGRNMSDTGRHSPLARALDDGALPDGAILTHMNYLTPGDWERLPGHRFSIVHCPCCHAYFDRPPFPMERFLAAGMNMCLGTDSLASNHALDMFAEMRTVAQNSPGVPAEAVLDMVTRNPARAIGLGGRLGELSPGAFADMICVPFTGAMDSTMQAAVAHKGPVSWSMVAGRRVVSENPQPDARARC